jgi:hypothetical protein
MGTDPTPAHKTEAIPPLEKHSDHHCPVCGAELTSEKCKVVCRSPRCVYRIIFNCAEF